MSAIFQHNVDADVDLHERRHPWCSEVDRILQSGGVAPALCERILTEFGHALDNDAPRPVSFGAILALGASVRLSDTVWTAKLFVDALDACVEGEGPTVEEAVLDAYSRQRQAQGNPLADRIASLLRAADAPSRVTEDVCNIIKRMRIRFSMPVQGTVAMRLAASPSPCPCCAKGRLSPVRYTEQVSREGLDLRVINLEGDYCSGCGETTSSPAAARRNEYRISTAAAAARKVRAAKR